MCFYLVITKILYLCVVSSFRCFGCPVMLRVTCLDSFRNNIETVNFVNESLSCCFDIALARATHSNTNKLVIRFEINKIA